MSSPESFEAFDAGLSGIHTDPSTQPPGLSSLTEGQMAGLGTAMMDGFLAQVLLALAGFLPAGSPVRSLLTQWATELQQAAQDALNTANAAQTTANTSLENWTVLLEAFDVPDAAALAQALVDAGSGNFTPLLQLLGLGSLADFVAWLQNAASGALTTQVSQAAITAANAQLLANPDFSGAISVSGNGIWSWDGTVFYTQPGGLPVADPGSAKLTATGILQGLQSNPSIGTLPLGQPIVYSVEVAADGLTGTGTMFELFAIPWIGTVAQTPVSIATVGAPTGTPSINWSGLPPTAKAGTLSGSYKPTTDSGVTSVSMQVIVAAAATGGTVWVSGGSEELTEGLIASLQADQDAGKAALSTLFSDWQAATVVFEGDDNWVELIDSSESAFATYMTTVSNLEAGEFATLQQLIGSWFGINTSTGFMSALKISGVLGGSSLGADVAAVNAAASDFIAYLTRWFNDFQVLGDWFHTTYPLGSPSDPPGTKIGGKLTWYGCYNDFLELIGLANSTPAPTTAAADIGTVILANTAAATTAGTNASLAIATNQSVIDQIFQSANGGNTTGNPVTVVLPSLTAIPASNIVGNTGAAVSFGAKGAGGLDIPGGGNSAATSWSHSILSTDLGVLVGISYEAGSDAETQWQAAVTYGGVPMTQVAVEVSTKNGGGSAAYLEVWWLKSPPTGSKTVAVTITEITGDGSVIESLGGCSVSYLASKINNIQGFSGSGTGTPAMSMASQASNMVVGFVAQLGPTTGFTSFAGYNTTERYLQMGSGASANWGLLITDEPGAATVPFTLTAPTTTTGWVGFTVELSN